MNDQKKTKQQLLDELLETRRNLQDTERILADQQDIREALAKSKQRYRELEECMGDWIWEIDAQHLFTYCSPQVKTILGYEPEDILGKHPADFLTGKDAEILPSFLVKLAAEPRIFYGLEASQRHADGSIRYLEINIIPLFGLDGVLTGFRGVTRDVTKRKIMAMALEEADELFRLVAQATNDAIYDWNLTSGTLWLSEPHRKIIGFPENHEHFRWWISRLHPDDRQRILSSVRSLLKGLSSAWTEEYQFLCANGRYASIVDRGQIIRNEKGIPLRIVGSMMDVTHRKLAQEALATSEENYRRLIEDSPIGILVYSPEGRIILCNRKAQLLLETSEADMLGSSPSHPAWKFVRADGAPFAPSEHPVSRAIASNAPINDVVIAVVRPISGTPGWFLVNAQPQWNAAGRLLRVVESFIDITIRMNALEALRESEAKYRFLTARTSDVVWMRDTGLFFTYISPSIRRVLNYEPDELLGRSISDIMPPETFDRVKELLGHELLRNQQKPVDPERTVTMDTTLVRKNGSIVWSENVVSFIRDRADRVVGIYGVSRNVTEHKLAEQEKERLIAELKTALAEVKTLSGLLPICSNCKKIRDDKGYWNQLEGYISDHSEALFSHSICPDCAEKLYKDIFRTKKPAQ